MAKKKDNTILWVIGVIIILVILISGGFSIFHKPQYDGQVIECVSNEDCQRYLNYPSVCSEGKCYATGGNIDSSPEQIAIENGIRVGDCVNIIQYPSVWFGQNIKKYVWVVDIQFGDTTQDGIKPVMVNVKSVEGITNRWDLLALKYEPDSTCIKLEN